MSKLIQAKTKTKARPKLLNEDAKKHLRELQRRDGLGPNQRALLKAARLKKYNSTQCKYRMHDGKGYDFLGLACLLAGYKPIKAAPGIYLYGTKKLQGVMPPEVVKHYGFRSSDGMSNRNYDSEKITYLTDFAEMPLVRLSSRIEANPQRYFEEPL